MSSLSSNHKRRDTLELTGDQTVATDEQIRQHCPELFEVTYYLNQLSRVLEGMKFGPKDPLKSHLDEESQQKLDACVSHLTEAVSKIFSQIPFEFAIHRASNDDAEELSVTRNREFTVAVSNAEALLESVKQPLENLKVLHDLSSLIRTLEKRIAELKEGIANPSVREVNSIERSEIEISVLEAELSDFEEFETTGKPTTHQRNQKKQLEDNLERHRGVIGKIHAKTRKKKRRIAFTQETLDQVTQLFTEFLAQNNPEIPADFSAELDLTKALNDNEIDTNHVSTELNRILQAERTGDYTAYYPEVESRQIWDVRKRRLRKWTPRLALILVLAGGAYAERDRIRDALEDFQNSSQSNQEAFQVTFGVDGREYRTNFADPEDMSDAQREFLRKAEESSKELRKEHEKWEESLSKIFIMDILAKHRELRGRKVIRWNEVISNFDEIKKMHEKKPKLTTAKKRIFKHYDAEMMALSLDQLISIYSAKDLNTLAQLALSSVESIRVSGKGVDWIRVSLRSSVIDIVKLVYMGSQTGTMRINLLVKKEGDVKTNDYQWERMLDTEEFCSPETKYLIAVSASNSEVLFKAEVKPPKQHEHDCPEDDESSLDPEVTEKKLRLFKERIAEDPFLSEFFDSKRKKMLLEAEDLSAFEKVFHESFSSVFVAHDYDEKKKERLPIFSDTAKLIIEIDPVFKMAVKALYGDEANFGLKSTTGRSAVRMKTDKDTPGIIIKKERELCDLNRLFMHGIFAPAQFEGDEPYGQMFISRASIILNTYCPKTVKLFERSLGVRYEPTVTARLAQVRASILEHPIIKKHATEKQMAQIARVKTEEELKERFGLVLEKLRLGDGSLAKELNELIDPFRSLSIIYDTPEDASGEKTLTPQNHTILNISVPPELTEALKKQYGRGAEVFLGFSNNGQRSRSPENQPLRVSKEELCSAEGEVYFFIETKFPIRKGVSVFLETDFTGLDNDGIIKSTFCKDGLRFKH